MGLSITTTKSHVSDLSTDSITYTVVTNTPYDDVTIKLTSHSENFLQIKQSEQADWATVGDEPTRLGPWHDNENNPSELSIIQSSEAQQFTFSLRKTGQQMDEDSVNVVLELTAIDSTSTSHDFTVTFTVKKLQESWKKGELPLIPGQEPMAVGDYTYNDWLKDVVDRINRDSNGTYTVHRLKGGTVEIKEQNYTFDFGLFVIANTPGSAGNNIGLSTSDHGVLPAATLTAGADQVTGGPGGAGGVTIDGLSHVSIGTNQGTIA